MVGCHIGAHYSLSFGAVLSAIIYDLHQNNIPVEARAFILLSHLLFSSSAAVLLTPSALVICPQKIP